MGFGRLGDFLFPTAIWGCLSTTGSGYVQTDIEIFLSVACGTSCPFYEFRCNFGIAAAEGGSGGLWIWLAYVCHGKCFWVEMQCWDGVEEGRWLSGITLQVYGCSALPGMPCYSRSFPAHSTKRESRQPWHARGRDIYCVGRVGGEEQLKRGAAPGAS